jgi:hypothetical protein
VSTVGEPEMLVLSDRMDSSWVRFRLSVRRSSSLEVLSTNSDGPWCLYRQSVSSKQTIRQSSSEGPSLAGRVA